MGYALTLADVRGRIQHKVGDERTSTRLDQWINDVTQQLTAELWVPELRSDGSSVITGDGSARIFDLPEDHHGMSWMYFRAESRDLLRVTSREMIEEWETTDSNTVIGFVSAYTVLGRVGTADSDGVPLYQVKFDRIPNTGDEIEFEYYRRHPEMVNDADLFLLPQHLVSIVVDGVMMEAAQWNNNTRKFEIYNLRYEQKLKRLKRSQNRDPDLQRHMGSGLGRGRSRRACLPTNIVPDAGYPRQ